MSTVLSSGKRRCDAICHNAKLGSKCTCICSGKFHGSNSLPPTAPENQEITELLSKRTPSAPTAVISDLQPLLMFTTDSTGD